MDFFSQYYYYLSFFFGCSLLLFSLACFLSWRLKFGAFSYVWMMLFGVSFAIVNFYQMFTPGSVYAGGQSSLTASVMLFVTMIFFFMAAQETYRKFKPSAFIKYLIVPPVAACIAAGVFFGVKWFYVSSFVFMWIPASVIMALSLYPMIKTDIYAGRNIRFVFVFFIIYCAVYAVSEAGAFFGMDMRFRAVSDALLSCVVFFLGALVFKYFKVSYEKQGTIYDYMPAYWKHIPIGSVLFAVLAGGLFFAMYLENYSMDNTAKNGKAVVANIAETVTAKLNKSDRASLVLSGLPFVAEAIAHPSDENKAYANRMLEYYCKTFDVSAIFAVNNSGDVVFYSNLVSSLGLSEANLKYSPYAAASQTLKHGRVFTKDLSGKNQAYFASDPVMNAGTGIGAIIVQDDIGSTVSMLRQFQNIYLIDSDGIILLSDKDVSSFNGLWPLYSAANENKSGAGAKKTLSKEVFDGDTVVLDGESFYVTRQAINEAGWSIVYFTSLSHVKQFKILSIAGVSAALIIILLLFWAVSQSNRILALALQHKAILNSAKSIVIVSSDLHGNIIVYGKGAEDILGYTKEEFINKGMKNIAFKDGAPIEFERAAAYSARPGAEIVCVRKDGTQITMIVSVLPQYSVGNKPIGYIFSGADITAVKKVEAELEQQIKFLQMLIDSMPIAVYYKDSEMHYIGCNKAFEEIMEHPKNFIIGKVPEDIYFDAEALEKTGMTDKMIKESMSSVTYENIVKFRNSPPRNLIHYKSAYKKIDGKFGGIIGIMLDVTHERKTQRERDILQANLIQQNKLASLGELSGSIAHELNNPLSIILGFAQVLVKDMSLSDEAKKGISNIYEAAKRSKGVITNMLEFSRSDTSKKQIVRINDIMESAILIVAKDFAKSGINIEKNLTKDNRSVLANPMQIQQLLLNMFLNAKDSMPAGGTMTVATDIKDKYFAIDISDTGTGIAKEIIPKIFDPFFTTKPSGKGTGLGLSICYGIVNAHKGEISVKSAVNKGASFSIKIPLNS